MGASLVLCLLTPAILLAYSSQQLDVGQAEYLGIAAVFLVTVCTLISAAYVNFAPLTAACCALAATYYGMLFVVFAYGASSWSRDFSPSFLAEYTYDIIPAAFRMFGLWPLVGVSAALLCAWCALFLLFFRLQRRMRIRCPWLELSWKPAVAAVVGVGVALTNASAYGEPISMSISGYEEEAAGQSQFGNAVFSNYEDFRTDSEESIFVLQLESVSSMALLRPYEISTNVYPGTYLPQLHAIAKDGVFFPFFLANQSPTNRAQETIHCGVVGNNARALSSRTIDIPKSCLPSLLAKSGYTTIAFRSDRPEFSNMGKFIKSTGFSELHYDDIMQPDDVKYPWGYDDCTYYKRAFDYLRTNYPDGKKLYVYFEVSSHHWPFTQKSEYQFAFPFKQPRSYLEKYINSASAQDSCLQTFYSQYNAYANDRTHLAIQSDHGFPLLQQRAQEGYLAKGVQSEYFFIPYVYVPPRSRTSEFAVGTERPALDMFAQEDILPTFLELLSGNVFANSLVPALKNQSVNKLLYEPCHVLVNGGMQSMAVIRNNREYIMYSSENQEVISVDLIADFAMKHPKVIERNVSAKAFRNTYYCERYRRAPYRILGPTGN